MEYYGNVLKTVKGPWIVTKKQFGVENVPESAFLGEIFHVTVALQSKSWGLPPSRGRKEGGSPVLIIIKHKDPPNGVAAWQDLIRKFGSSGAK